MSRKLSTAFTLIELLVVISIIALLIAILLPALAAARQTARASACSSQMRQVGIAMHAYAAEHEDLLPYGYLVTSSTFKVTWDDLLNSYLGGALTAADISLGVPQKAIAVMVCPSDEIPAFPAFSTNAEYRRTYAVPRMGTVSQTLALFDRLGVSSFDSPNPNFRSYRLTETLKPTETFVLVEKPNAYNILGNESGATAHAPVSQSDTNNSGGTVIDPGDTLPLHGGRSESGAVWNYAYADGHVASQRPIDTLGTGAGAAYPNYCLGPWTRNPND